MTAIHEPVAKDRTGAEAAPGDAGRPSWALPAIASAILLISLLVRLYFLDLDPTVPAGGDQGEYYGRAAMVADGTGYYDPPKWVRAPLYVFFLAGVFEVFGPAVLHVRLIQILLGLASVLLVFATVRRVSSERAAMVAMALAGLYLPLATVSNLVMAETLFVALLLASIYLFTRWSAGSEEKWLLAVGGIALGLAALTRSYALLFLPLVLAWLWLRSRSTGRRSRVHLGILAVVFVLTVAPWMVRNAAVYQAFIPVDTTGGYNFWLAHGGFADKSEMEKVLLPISSYAERDRYAYGEGLRSLLGQPRRSVETMVTNLFYLAKLEYLPDIIRVDKEVSGAERAATAVLGDLPFVAALAFGPAGLLLLRRRPEVLLFGLWPAFCGLLALFTPVDFVGLRYRLPMMPFLLIGLAVFAGQARGLLVLCRRQKWVAGAVLISVLFLLMELFAYQNLPLVAGRVLERQRLVSQAQELFLAGDYESAGGLYTRAVDIQPDYLDALLGKAGCLLALGRMDEAAVVYEAALAVNPYDVRPRAGLGEIYRRRGETAKAVEQLDVTDEQKLLEWSFRWLPVEDRSKVDMGYLDAGYVEGFRRGQGRDGVTYRRTAGVARVRLDAADAKERLSIRMSGMGAGKQLDVKVSIDGKEYGVFSVGEEFEVYSVEVSEAAWGSEPVVVELRSETFEEGAGSEARRSGVAVDWVELK